MVDCINCDQPPGAACLKSDHSGAEPKTIFHEDAGMTKHLFDDSHIHWQTLTGFEHLQYSILGIDEQCKIIDV